VTTKEILEYLAKRVPIENLPLNWDATGYTTEDFNQYVVTDDFKGWEGDRPDTYEVETIVKLLGVRRGETLLDIACGYGRHALLLGEKHGLSVIGIDISPGLIQAAKKRAANTKNGVSFEVMHARDIRWQDEFGHAIVVFNSFSLFSPQDAPLVLKAVNRALKPQGRLFMDLDNKPFNCRYGTRDTKWYTLPDSLLLQDVFFHEDISVEVIRDIYFTAGTKHVEEFVCLKRIYLRQEIEELLSRNGFTISATYGDWDLSPLSNSSPKMLITARKPE
jgi:ubiquinone/menaquinone biosynthesis C-methylase UbiE